MIQLIAEESQGEQAYDSPGCDCPALTAPNRRKRKKSTLVLGGDPVIPTSLSIVPNVVMLHIHLNHNAPNH
jgi:hypothetical protein